MGSFRLFTLLATAGTYLLIFMGGLVRVSGAGLGCPDWPKCFGRWIPPISAAQLPPEIDPQFFNITLAWIEYTNRLLGVAVGILIAIVGLLALKSFRKQPRIVVPSVLAAILTAFQGWQGSQVVASDLEPLVISMHLVIALIIVSLLVYVWLQTCYLDRGEINTISSAPTKLRRWIGVVWLLALVQVVLGTQLRGAIETATTRFPLLFGADLIEKIGAVKYYHPIFGIVTAGLTLVVVVLLLRREKPLSPLLWQSAWTMGGLTVLQLVLGAGMVWFGNPPVGQLLHLWVASLLIGVILISYADSGWKGAER